MIETIRSVEQADDPPREQLRKVAEILLRSWARDPDLVRVLVREVTRSQHLQGEMDEIVAVLRRRSSEIVERGQADGSIRADLDAAPRELHLLRRGRGDPDGLGARALPDCEEDVARAERTVVEIVTGGLAPELATAGR